MKVSIGSRIVLGPWGGGNLFAINLSNYLKKNGHEVRYDLVDRDIDLILLTDPRSRRESSSTFNHYDIKQYKKYVNPNVKVVQRINECDERKNTNNINSFYLDASNVADHVVFVSSWLQKIYTDIGLDSNKSSVILAGANSDIFNRLNHKIWSSPPLKIVTHHWSSHENKGFETYKLLDSLLNTKKWKDKIEFTYIGNLNENYTFSNTKLIEPLAGKDLANELKKNHIYVTGSINEPSGNHHIEAAQCGLPLLFKNSGGIPEYCTGFGVPFDNNFEEALEEIYKNYKIYIEKLNSYPFNSNKMCEEFFELFSELTKKQVKKSSNKYLFISRYIIFKNRYMSIVRGLSVSLILNKIKNLIIIKRNHDK